MNDLYGPLDEKKKKAGSESSKESSLRDWFGRKGAKGSKKGWVDCNSPDGSGGYKACGRGSGEKRKKYPACRPTPGACKERGKGKSWGKKAKSKKKNEELYKMDLYQIIEEEIEAVVTETHTKEHEKELEKIADELAGASKMHKGQSDQIKKILDQTEEPEEPVNEGMNCGCGNDPCETYGKNNEKLIIVIKEELSAVREDRQTHIAGITKKIARLEQAIINAEKGMKNMDDSADDDTDLSDVRNSKAYFAKQSEVMNLRDKLEVLEDQLQQLQQDGPVELTRGLEETEYEPGRAVADIDTGEERMSPEDLMRDEVQDLADKFGVEASIEIASDGKPVILVTHRNGETTPYDDTEEMYRDLSDEVGRRDFGDPNEDDYDMYTLDEKKKKKQQKGKKRAAKTKKRDKKKKSSAKKDACYNKVKSRYKVWPSAYASGALVKCRKVGAANWGNSKKESLQMMIEDELAQVLDEKKHKFSEGKKLPPHWLAQGLEADPLCDEKVPDGASMREYKKCLESPAAYQRPPRRSLEEKAKKPCKPSKGKRFAKRVDGKCRSFGQKGQAKGGGDRIRPGTAKGDAYCARSAKIKKCKNPPCANALSRKKWKCRGSKSMKEAVRKINVK